MGKPLGNNDKLVAVQMRLQGFTSIEIAKQTGRSRYTIEDFLSRDEGKNMIQELVVSTQERIRRKFSGLSDAAYNTIQKILKEGKAEDRIKFDAAIEVLNRAGCKPKDVVENIQRYVPLEESQSALATVQELEKMAGRLLSDGSKHVLRSGSVRLLVTREIEKPAQQENNELPKDEPGSPAG